MLRLAGWPSQRQRLKPACFHFLCQGGLISEHDHITFSPENTSSRGISFADGLALYKVGFAVTAVSSLFGVVGAGYMVV